MTDMDWTCRCGAVAIRLRDMPQSGVPAICHCRDCRAFARLHGAADDLDAAGGIGLVSTTADKLDMVRGADKLACERLTRRGPLRWFTACCDTPLGNGAPIRAVPFFSVLSARLEGDVPKPVARLHRGSATGPVPKPHGSAFALLGGVAKRVLAARLSGRWKDTPFFTDDARPVARPDTPDADVLRAAYDDAR